MALIIEKLDNKNLEKVKNILHKGGVVVFPTETVFGIGAWIHSKEGVEKIFKIKGRPKDNPLIVHISNMSQLREIAELTEEAKELIKRFWPGPLTLVLKAKKGLSKSITAGLPTVAVRMPAHEKALKLIEAVGPIAAPSANISGRPSITRWEDAVEELGDKADVIIKGEVKHGLESTIIKLSPKPMLLRPGAIPLEKLEEILGPIEVVESSENPEAPGMKYRHYSPSVPVITAVPEKVKELNMKEFSTITPKGFGGDREYKDEAELAKNLFRWFRELEKKEKPILVVVKKLNKGLLFSIWNRLKKASSKILD